MKLSQIANFFNLTLPNRDGEFKNLSLSSKELLDSSAYIAIQGAKIDGHQYIEEAIQVGFQAIIAEKPPVRPCEIPYLVFPELKRNLAVLAGIVYPGYAKIPNLIGVTGTNGKTTIATLLKYLINHFDNPCGLMGTIEFFDGRHSVEATHTTPPLTDIYRLLHQCYSNDVKHCVMEVSSHALKQNRIGNMVFNAGVFTNLTQDHLDYHLTMEDYEKSKLLFLNNMDNNSVIIVNDNDFGNNVKKVCQQKIVSVGQAQNCDYFISNIKLSKDGSLFDLCFENQTHSCHLLLIGMHNIYNCVQSVACLHQLGYPLIPLLSAVKSFRGVSGRLEKISVNGSNEPAVFVDYAHTPDAIESVLNLVSVIKGTGKVWVVFGCGGDRDKIKRPLMASSAEKGADFVVVTSDNPRTEKPMDIIDDILVGFSEKKHCVWQDRRLAITYAIQNAKGADTILILGKGHENYQIVGNVKRHFDDREEALEALKKRGKLVC